MGRSLSDLSASGFLSPLATNRSNHEANLLLSCHFLSPLLGQSVFVRVFDGTLHDSEVTQPLAGAPWLEGYRNVLGN